MLTFPVTPRMCASGWLWLAALSVVLGTLCKEQCICVLGPCAALELFCVQRVRLSRSPLLSFLLVLSFPLSPSGALLCPAPAPASGLTRPLASRMTALRALSFTLAISGIILYSYLLLLLLTFFVFIHDLVLTQSTVKLTVLLCITLLSEACILVYEYIQYILCIYSIYEYIYLYPSLQK